MKKKLATFCCALLAIGGIKAQNNALQFDGVDDYLEAQSFPPLNSFHSSGFTVEVIFRKFDNKPNQVLIAQNNRLGAFIVGLNVQGEPYTTTEGTTYTAHGTQLQNHECYHLSIVYLPGSIEFYVNGNPVFAHPNIGANTGLNANEVFYVGQAFPDNASTLFGEIDDMRIFTDERTPFEIQQFTFLELPLQVDNKFVYFSFNALAGNYFPDPFYSGTKAWPGGQTLTPHQMPQSAEGHCAEMLPQSSLNSQTESIDTANVCHPLPPCSTAGLPANELLCNGNFEQYCSL